MTSTDGFCSVVIFTPEELGQVYNGPVPPLTPNSSTSNTMPTPASKLGPTSHPPPSPAPTRTNPSPSTPQIETNNPTPTVGSVPSVTASSSSVSSIPLTTPPQTPHPGSVLGKRDGEIGAPPKVLPGDVPVEPAEGNTGGDKKRRRIAPTLVDSSVSSEAHEKPQA